VDYGAGGVENFVGAQVPHFKEALFLHPWLLALHLRWQAFLSVGADAVAGRNAFAVVLYAYVSGNLEALDTFFLGKSNID